VPEALDGKAKCSQTLSQLGIVENDLRFVDLAPADSDAIDSNVFDDFVDSG
jgi:hypothetical protein